MCCHFLFSRLASVQEFNPLLACNAARVPYFLDTMRSVLCCGDSLQSIRILDVGCGGGLVTEKIAQSSCAHVTGMWRRRKRAASRLLEEERKRF